MNRADKRRAHSRWDGTVLDSVKSARFFLFSQNIRSLEDKRDPKNIKFLDVLEPDQTPDGIIAGICEKYFGIKIKATPKPIVEESKEPIIVKPEMIYNANEAVMTVAGMRLGGFGNCEITLKPEDKGKADDQGLPKSSGAEVIPDAAIDQRLLREPEQARDAGPGEDGSLPQL